MVRQSDAQATFRLPRKLAERIARMARASGRRRSDILREAAEAYVELAGAAADSPAARVRDLIGSVRSGVPDLAARHSEYLKQVRRRGR